MVRSVRSVNETVAACAESTERDRGVVLYFTASWCGPCRRIKKPLQALAEEYADKLDVYAVDVDEVKEVAEVYRVSSMPTFVFCAKNTALFEFSGADEVKLARSMRKLAEHVSEA